MITHELLRDAGLAVLRLGLGPSMLLAHGWPKLAGFAEKAGSFPDPLGVGPTASLVLAIFAEAICALLVTVGAATRIAAFFLAFTMGVAAFVVHAGDPFAQRELALVYAIPFASLVLLGPGRLSADFVLLGWWRSQRRARPATATA